MKWLFIVDPLPGLKAYKDSSVAMMREAARRGHPVFATEAISLAWENGSVTALVKELTVGPDNVAWYGVSIEARVRLADFDAVLMRKDPPFDAEFVANTWMLERAEAEGVRVFNAPRALRDHSEKLALAEFARFAPPTLFAAATDVLNAFVDEHRDTILKPLDGMGGTGIFRVRADDPNRNVIIETLTQGGCRTIVAQRYLAEIVAGDKRVLVIAGKPVPYCLARIPKAGETRGNLAAGGTGVARPLTERDREIAETLGPALAARGLLLVGLDVIGDHLTEINVTSPTCFVEITTQTGCDVAALFIDALEQACA